MSYETDFLKQAGFSLAQLKDYSSQMQIYRAAIKEVQTKLEILDDAFKVQYEHNPIHHIESRLKSPMSIAEKLSNKGMPVTIETMETGLSDIAGVRVICNYLDDVEQVASLLLAQDDVMLIERKDYIERPKSNGYRSLHLVISIPIFLAGGRRDTEVEVQIRTLAMDMWASLEHRLFYKNESLSQELQNRLISCSNELERIDLEMQQIRYNAMREKARHEAEGENTRAE